MPLEALDEWIERELRPFPDTAFTLAVVRGGEVVYEHGVRASASTPFRSGSLSKTLTAIAVLRLVEEGTLALDEPVVSYLPWLRLTVPTYASGVTLRRLLSHSSGLFGTADMDGSAEPEALGVFVRDAIPRAAFPAPPGAAFEYSSVGFDLAGHVAEVAAGEPFAHLVARTVFAPLELEDSGYLGGAAANPAANACCSTRDLARVAVALLSAGSRLLRPESVAELLAPQISLRNGAGGAYGLGLWLLDHSGHPWATHAGLRYPSRCELSLFPRDGLGVIFQCDSTNDFNPEAIRRAVVEELLGPGSDAAPRRAVADVAPAELASGSYFGLAGGFARIEHDDGAVTVTRGTRRTLLAPSHDGCLASADGAVVVGPIADIGFMCDEHLYTPFDEKRIVKLPYDTLAALAATYEFEDGDTATARVVSDELAIRFDWLDHEYQCFPLDERRFASDAGLLVFDSGRLEYQGFVTGHRQA